jgi:hypothetical protein
MTSRDRIEKIAAAALLAAPLLMLPGAALAQFTPAEESLSDLYPGKAY